MKQPTISVVIPAYNAGQTLQSTVESVFSQTFQDYEIIITDDGSEDDTLHVAHKIAQKDSRVIVKSQQNGGAAAARNTCLSAARGKYVALLDADDLWLPNKLERQIEYLEANPSVHAVQCGAFFVDNEMNILSVRPCTDHGDSFRETLLFKNLPAFLSALMVRRDRIVEVGMFDTELEILEEWDMALKMARFCNMRSIEDPLVLYRVHPGNRHNVVKIHIKPGLLILSRIFADSNLPDEIRRIRAKVYGTFYRTLSGGYFNQRDYVPFLKWGIKSIKQDPIQLFYMAKLPLRRLERYRSRRGLKAQDVGLVKQLKESL